MIAVLASQAPIFADPKLLRPTSRHSTSCANRRGGPCRCGLAMWITTSTQEVQVLERQKEASRIVLAPWTAPVWVETSLLHAWRKESAPRTPEEPKEQARDIDLVRTQLKLGPLTYGRRRLRPKCGELVFIRGQSQAPWRFLAVAGTGERALAILVDPEVAPSNAMTPDWPEAQLVELDGGEPWRKLLVVFPLPDGTENPGWR